MDCALWAELQWVLNVIGICDNLDWFNSYSLKYIILIGFCLTENLLLWKLVAKVMKSPLRR
jgi:hypothetical protein